MQYLSHLLIYFGWFAILSVSLNLIVGQCGLLSLAHAAYFGIGAYVYAVLHLNGWGFLPASLCSVVVAFGLSAALSVPAWRLKGDSFVMMSIAVQVLGLSIVENWDSPGDPIGSWANLTNGERGISGITRPCLLGLELNSVTAMAGLSLAIAILCCLCVRLLINSPWGRAVEAMRDDEAVARGLGRKTRRLKFEAIAIACGMAGLAGALSVSYLGHISPIAASFEQSILILSMLLVGGTGNLRGPVVGAIVVLLIGELINLAHLPKLLETDGPQVRLLAYGILLILLMHFRPTGLAGLHRVD